MGGWSTPKCLGRGGDLSNFGFCNGASGGTGSVPADLSASGQSGFRANVEFP